MNVRHYAAWTALVAGVLAVGWLSWEYRRQAQEDALEQLAFDEFEVKDATFEQALRLVTEKVHALGHPELELVVYQDAATAPGFRRTLESLLGEKTESFSKHYEKAPYVKNTLRSILDDINNHFGGACALRGRRLVAVHASGTMEAYQHKRLPIFKGGPEIRDESRFHRLLLENGAEFYEDMTVKIHPGQAHDEIEMVAPRREVEYIYFLLGPDYPPTRWEEWKVWVRERRPYWL